MFWRMTGLTTASPVETILDKESFTLEELLDEDEIIQECKALNGRLINFLRERPQVEQLLRYIVEEAADDAEKKRSFKFPFIACEIFTCEVDIILKTLVEDEELMNLLFSFLKPDHSHSNLLAGYFSKVVICLLSRKTVPFMNYVQYVIIERKKLASAAWMAALRSEVPIWAPHDLTAASPAALARMTLLKLGHQGIFRELVDLIGITSIMEVLIRLIGADDHMYNSYMDSMQWLEDTNVLEMIVDKFSSSDCPEVHANAAETLCSITRYAPSGLAAKIYSPSFVGRLFAHALESSRPKSVLIHSLSICISLLDPRRMSVSPYSQFRGQQTLGSAVSANPEMVNGMLESVGDLLKLLDISSSDIILQTTYGKLQPPLGKHRLKIVEFISVLLTVGSEAAEMKLIELGALKRIIGLFFEYPYNNFLHHHVENIIVMCLESKKSLLLDHLFRDCDIVGKMLEAESNSTLSTDSGKPTVLAEGKLPPKVGNIGHLTRISNKLVQLGSCNEQIQQFLQENSEWLDWQSNVLSKRNTVENVYQWACGRPTALQDRTRDSDDEDFRDRDYDVAALASNLSQAFHYGNYDEIEEAHGSLERDDEDVYFDDESAEVVISSLRLGDDQDSGSLFTNSNWFAFEDDRVVNDHSTNSPPSTSPTSTKQVNLVSSGSDVVTGGDEGDLDTTGTSFEVDSSMLPSSAPENGALEDSNEDMTSFNLNDGDKAPEWIEWRDTADAGNPPVIPNGDLLVAEEEQIGDEGNMETAEPLSSGDSIASNHEENSGSLVASVNESTHSDVQELRDTSEVHEPVAETPSSDDVETVEHTETPEYEESQEVAGSEEDEVHKEDKSA